MHVRLHVADEQGKLIASSGPLAPRNVSDRDYFPLKGQSPKRTAFDSMPCLGDCPLASAHPARAPDAFTTFAHFAVSLRINAANCSGVPVVGAKSAATRRSW